jgi:hypothetical protein
MATNDMDQAVAWYFDSRDDEKVVDGDHKYVSESSNQTRKPIPPKKETLIEPNPLPGIGKKIHEILKEG